MNLKRYYSIPPPPIAGMPFIEAKAIFQRHVQELQQLPGVRWVMLGPDGIIVETDNPTAVPPAVEGLPITTRPLQEEPIVTAEDMEKGTLPGAARKVEPMPERDCGPYAHWNAATGRCRRDALPPDSRIRAALARKPLPPPPGVIILRPSRAYAQNEPCPSGFVRSWDLDHYVCYEQAEACPEGFKEETEHGWQFCLPPEYTEHLPPLWESPIAGVPYYEAQAILERHQDTLMQLPGVSGVGLGPNGISVWTKNPAVVPKEVEGLRIETLPFEGPARTLNHTSSTRFRPLHASSTTARARAIQILAGQGRH